MRLTLQIDDDLHHELKHFARREGLTLSGMLNRLLRESLSSKQDKSGEDVAFRQSTFHMGKPLVNLDKALDVVDTLNDEEIQRKLDRLE